jgi:hypothetical protein
MKPRLVQLTPEQRDKVIELVDEHGIVEAILYLRDQFPGEKLTLLRNTAENYRSEALTRSLERLYKQMSPPNASEESR